jgi:hypothetical protein
MLTREKQLALIGKIRGYRKDFPGTNSADEAYRHFFPQAVQQHEFADCWNAVIEEDRAAAKAAAKPSETTTAQE